MKPEFPEYEGVVNGYFRQAYMVLHVSSFASVIKLRKGRYFVKLNTCPT
jgi:hypothetical protein